MTASLVLRRRIAIVLIAATIVVGMAGIGGLQLNSHYSAYFNRDDPRILEDEHIRNIYARQDSLLVVLATTHSFLEQRHYYLLEDLTEMLAEQPSVTSAVSITELGIVGNTLTEDGSLIPGLQQLKENGHAIGLLLSEDARYAGVWLQVDLPDKSARTVLETVDGIREAVGLTIANLPVTAHYTGTLALNEAYIKVVQHDLRRIVPLLLLVMIVVLSLLLRTTRAAFMVLPVGICSVLAAFGVAGLFGAELAAINSFTPIIVFSISVAGCVHMALSYDHYRDTGMRAHDAATTAVDYNRVPMLLANGTTALGFLGLTLSPSPPVRVVGYLVASGILISFALCMTLLPVMQARFDPWKPRATALLAGVDWFSLWGSRMRIGLITIFLLLSLPAAWFASQNVISDNVFEYFPASHPFHRDTQLVEDHLSGINEMLFSVSTGRDLGLLDADAIEKLALFSSWLQEQPEVNQVTSIADDEMLTEARREGRLQERLDFYRNRIDSSAQRSPLLELAVSRDYSSSLVTAYLRQLDSAQLTGFDHRVRSWAAENMNEYTLGVAGASLMFASLGEQNIRSMLMSLTVALFVAALILGAVFRSGRLAWIGVICNILPILLVYSIWAVVYGRISIGAAVVMGMILGIVLDDTIYLLAAYRRCRQDNAADPVRDSVRRVGPALVVTTITLVAGLSTGLLSDFGPIWSMSVLSVSIIVTALLVDLLMLPALLSTSRSRGDGR